MDWWVRSLKSEVHTSGTSGLATAGVVETSFTGRYPPASTTFPTNRPRRTTPNQGSRGR